MLVNHYLSGIVPERLKADFAHVAGLFVEPLLRLQFVPPDVPYGLGGGEQIGVFSAEPRASEGRLHFLQRQRGHHLVVGVDAGVRRGG